MKGLGITFTERMSGHFALGAKTPKEGEETGEAKKSEFTMNVTIMIDDIDKFTKDPKHKGELSGTIDFTGFGQKIPISNGVFNLFSPGNDPKMKYMVYDFTFLHGNNEYYFSGKKEVKDDPGFDLYSDTTTLFSLLHEGKTEKGKVLGAGILHISMGDLIEMIKTIKPVNAEDLADKLTAVSKFGSFFLGELWDTYAGFATDYEVKKKINSIKMVGWFNPGILVRTGVEAVVSSLFGQFADYRQVEIFTREQNEFDYSDKKELWVDYVADLGDGWDSTYSVAYLLSKETLNISDGEQQYDLKRGEVTIMGGDQVYPSATPEDYNDRMVLPYKSALPEAKNPVDLFLVPGNHDWYDGLQSFTRLFCQGRWIGGRKTHQKRSYFALHFPGKWWVLAIDVQLKSDIDTSQVEYFKDIIKTKMKKGDNVILCLAEPAWVYSRLDDDKLEKNIAFIEKLVIQITGNPIDIHLSGDLHHYRRYESKDGTMRQKITAGGGGAFLHPTHGPDVSEVTKGPDGKYEFELKKEFPDRKTSFWLSCKNFLFPFKNPKFGLITGFLYLLTVWILHHEMAPTFLATPITWENIPKVVMKSVESTILDFTAFFFTLLVVIGLFFFAKAKQNWAKLALSVSYASAHYTLNFFSGWALALLIQSYFPDMSIINKSLAIGGGLFIAGWILGGFVMGIYLFFSINLFNIHVTESFSSNRIADYKNFLRMKIEKDGKLTIYPVGIRKVCHKWKLSFYPEGPRFTPEEKIEYKLIEKPIKVFL